MCTGVQVATPLSYKKLTSFIQLSVHVTGKMINSWIFLWPFFLEKIFYSVCINVLDTGFENAILLQYNFVLFVKVISPSLFFKARLSAKPLI